MIRVVLDTNVLASGTLASTGTVAQVIDLWRRNAFAVIVSAEILEEFAETLRKPYFAARLTAEHIDHFRLSWPVRQQWSPIRSR